jgi:hypothetical protein
MYDVEVGSFQFLRIGPSCRITDVNFGASVIEVGRQVVLGFMSNFSFYKVRIRSSSKLGIDSLSESFGHISQKMF